ncbi:MAG: PTS IIBC subunit, partial [Ruminococcus sp.]|nr:PTS IIBC subunit [Ruminococcus sp.]
MDINDSKKVSDIISPLNGSTVPLESVPDEVFSQKVLGDGIAVIPTDGKIYSPVDGIISSIAETSHAYGFRSDDGLEILVHFGLETVSLKGDGFTSYVKVGDRVKKGDLVAEVDLQLLRQHNINTLTPVLVCDGAEDLEMIVHHGQVERGKTVLISLREKAEEVPSEVPTQRKKSGINFDLLQKLGKVLMTVIAVMPAAGL